MLGRFYQAANRRAAAKVLRDKLAEHEANLKTGPIRVTSIINSFEDYLRQEPKFAQAEIDLESEQQSHEIVKNSEYFVEENSWKLWRKWALGFDDSLKTQSKCFARKIVDSGAHNFTNFNRKGISSILDNVYHAALSLRIGGALSVCVTAEESRRAMECDLKKVILQSVGDVKALCVEKYAVAPQIIVEFEKEDFNLKVFEHDSSIYDEYKFVKGNLEWPIIAVESQIRYVLVETLKNAAKSVIRKYGVLDVEDYAEPIYVYVSKTNLISVRDFGVGLEPEHLEKSLSYFYTSSDKPIKSFAQASDAFGTPFAGVGFGLPRIKVYLDFHGASFGLESEGSGKGATVSIQLPRYRNLSIQY